MQWNNALKDYRFYARMPLPLEVELRMHHDRLGPFPVRDMDVGGLFVETDQVELYPNDVVEVDFVPGGAGAARLRGFRARVVRHAADGVGLMFLDYDQASFGALLDVMVAANERS
jgi:hypothetical protein